MSCILFGRNSLSQLNLYRRKLLPTSACVARSISSSSRRRFVTGSSVAGEWRNESPTGGLTELYVYKDSQATQWPDSELGVFAPVNPRFVCPGNVGLVEDKEALAELQEEEEAKEAKEAENLAYLSDVLTRPTHRERQVQVLYTVSDYLKHTPGAEEAVCSGILLQFPQLPGMSEVSCEVHEAPMLLKKEVKDLFPDRDLSQTNLSLVTIAQKSSTDMSAWSNEMEDEREKLAEQFFMAAKEICARLKEEGHWADFIDPNSGTPHYGHHSSTTMFETDEKYRLLGFRIEDLGCCKVICHKKYGRNVFVGTIFTDSHVATGVIGDVFEDLNIAVKTFA